MKRLLLCSLLCTTIIIGNAQPNLHSLSFDYVGAYVDIPHVDVLNVTEALTIEAWIKPNSWSTNIWENYIVGKDDWSNTSAGYALRGGDDGRLSFNIASNGGWSEVVSDPLLTPGSWYHVAGTYDGTVMKIYIDGFNVASLEYTGTITPSLFNLNIGNVPFLGQGNRLFDGLIDQVDIWNIALTESQINDYIECSPTGTEPGLIGLWKFEEGSGTVTADYTSNHNNGSLIENVGWSNEAPENCGGTIGTTDIINETVSVFPNPSTGEFTVHATIDGQYSIINELGQSIKTFTFNNSNQYAIQIQGLKPGVYFITGNSKDQLYYRKIVVR
jgi:hypothetical protein